MYTIGQLARISGVSPRALRYYGEIGLLQPRRDDENGYRLYGPEDVDRLQQILFYRELGIPLEAIREILSSGDFSPQKALEGHLAALTAEKERLERLIENVQKTLKTLKGEAAMSDQEKFEGFLRELVDENERRYGAEARAKYGDEAVERANRKVLGMPRESYENTQALQEKLEETLKAAVETGDAAGPLAREACRLHKEWLMRWWDGYSKEAHLGLTATYVEDPRFRAYYDNIAPGAAEFLHRAMALYLGA